jgi:hypothetical protein
MMAWEVSTLKLKGGAINTMRNTTAAVEVCVYLGPQGLTVCAAHIAM